MKLHQLKQPAGSRHSTKRVGRGDSSGHGSTSTRGNKGHRSRAGFSLSFSFEGGQMPLARRVPKRGFTHRGPEWSIVNLSRLGELFKDGDVVTPGKLREAGAVRDASRVKILGDGSLALKLEVRAHAFSEKARRAIEKSGGSCVVEGKGEAVA